MADDFDKLDELIKIEKERLKIAESIVDRLEEQSSLEGSLSKKEKERLMQQREVANFASEAVDYIQEYKDELLEVNKIDRSLLDRFRERASVAAAIKNLNKDNASQYVVGTEALKASSQLLRESVQNFTQSLGLSKEMTNEQRSQIRLAEQRRQIEVDRLEKEQNLSKIIYDIEQKRWIDSRHGNRFISEANVKRMHQEVEIAKEVEGQLELAEQQVRQAEKLNIISERLPSVIGESVGKLTDMWKFVKIGGLLAVGVLALTGVFGLVSLAISGIVKLFKIAWEQFKLLDEAAVDFRKETGLVGKLSRDVVNYADDIYFRYRSIGVEIQDVYEGAAAWREQLASTIPLTARTAEFLTLWTNKLAISKDSGVGFLKTLMTTTGASEDVALHMASVTAELARQEGVGAAEVFSNIRESASEINLYMRGNRNLMIASAIESRRMGINLSDVANTAESLLDFESSIGAEMKASALLGKRVNFGLARRLAFEGDIVGAQEEALRVIKSTGDFLSMNVFEKRALAEASGIDVDLITKQLTIERALGTEGSHLRDIYEDLNDELKDRVDFGSKTLATDLKRLQAEQSLLTNAERIRLQWEGIFIDLAVPFLGVIEKLVPTAKYVLGEFSNWLTSLGTSEVIANKMKEVIEGIDVRELSNTLIETADKVKEIIDGIINAYEFITGKRDVEKAVEKAQNRISEVLTLDVKMDQYSTQFNKAFDSAIDRLQGTRGVESEDIIDAVMGAVNARYPEGNIPEDVATAILDRITEGRRTGNVWDWIRQNIPEVSLLLHETEGADLSSSGLETLLEAAGREPPTVTPIPLESPAQPPPTTRPAKDLTETPASVQRRNEQMTGQVSSQVPNQDELVTAFLSAVGNRLVLQVDGKELGNVILRRQEVT